MERLLILDYWSGLLIVTVCPAQLADAHLSLGASNLICIVSLGLDEADAQRSNLEVYKEHFQEHFITATQAYYKAESTDFVANNSVSDYMKKAENRLQEEADRVNLYLNDATRTVVSW